MTIDKIDRALYEEIRLRVVELGYLPDITLSPNAAHYNAAKEALKLALPDHKLMEIYGVGSMAAKGESHVNRFSINRKSVLPGTVGAQGAILHEKYKDGGNNDRFRRMQYPDTMSTVVYEIRTITDSTKYERIMEDILRHVFGARMSIPPRNTDGSIVADDYLDIINNGGVNVSGVENIIEWLFTYTIKDAWVGELRMLRDNIVPITSIEFGIYENGGSNEELFKTDNY